MKTTIKASGFKHSEYLIVLNANEDTSTKIINIKKQFSEQYTTAPVYLQPQIMLLHFIQFEMIEERLLNHLKNISNGYNAFQVKLKDCGSFPTHTIFINLESKQQVQNLVTKLKSVQRLITLDKENKPHFMDDFYFSIARKLLPWQYEKAWLEYSKRNFTASFIADGFTLLKRPLESSANGFRPKGSYKVLKRFKFMNSPVITTQGELFM
jgi:2'-5' RNA ligase